ncbi:MAG: DUF4269 domain-containing protein, partial [Desulfobacteraceae bacterium]
KLRMSGMKTEPAFATYFGIPGDPFGALFELSYLSDDALERFLLGGEGDSHPSAQGAGRDCDA